MKIRSIMEETKNYPTGDGMVRIVADNLEIFIDTSSLAESLAAVGANQLIEAIRNSSTRASESTIKSRKRRGIQSERLFNETGYLANGIRAERVADATYDIVGPPGRLVDERVMELFEEHVLQQMFNGPLEIKVADEIEHAVDDMAKIRKASSGYF